VDDARVLVKKAQNNDLDAFEELVRIYENKVYALCVHLAGSHADAQDLAQETFIRAYRSLGSFRREADFGTWLHRIAVNMWLNLRRKNSARQALYYLDEPYQSGDGSEVSREIAGDSGDPLQMLEEGIPRSGAGGAGGSFRGAPGGAGAEGNRGLQLRGSVADAGLLAGDGKIPPQPGARGHAAQNDGFGAGGRRSPTRRQGKQVIMDGLP